jgi:hypothetical protein
MKRRPRTFDIITLATGLALLIYLVRQVGLGNVYTRVYTTGSGFILILLVSSIRSMTRSWAWLKAMTVEERKVGFFSVWRARLVGDAMGALTTAGPLIAEPFRLKALSGKLPIGSSFLSLTVETLAYIVSCCLMVFAGAVLLLAGFVVGGSLWAVSVVIIFFALTVTAAAVIVIRRRWTLLSDFGDRIDQAIGTRRHRPWLEHKLEYLSTLEAHVFDFYSQRPIDFFVVALCEAGFHMLGVAEIYVTLSLIGFETTLLTAFIFEAVNRVINIVFNFVPARIGVDEAGSILLAQALGIGAEVGVALAIIRKARVLFWSAVGLIFFTYKGSVSKHWRGR